MDQYYVGDGNDINDKDDVAVNDNVTLPLAVFIGPTN